MTGQIIVKPLDVMADADWSFRDSQPLWRHRRHGSVGTFDPFPAYRHDMEVVEMTAGSVAGHCPPRWDVELFAADREEIGRSNGYSHAHVDGHSDVDGQWVRDEPVGLIMLSGKRVPPHPALTRYLVTHEYGHNIEWMLNDARSAAHLHDDKLIAEYAGMRGLPLTTLHHGSGGRWHNSATEIFACDFRIVVCDVESDYWPHPGVAHPRDLDRNVYAWWADAMTLLAAKQ